MSRASGFYWFWQTARAFVRRDVLFETSYKLQTLVNLLGVFSQILTFYFIARLADVPSDQQGLHGADYFTFVLIGITFREVLDAGFLMHFTASLRQQLMVGAFEAMCATPLRPAPLMFYSLLWPVAGALLKAALYLLLGGLLLGAQIGLTRIPLLLAALALSIVVFGSMAMIAGSMILYFKRGDPVTWLLSNLAALIGGVFFPVGMMPGWLQKLSVLIPLPHALGAIRAGLIPRSDLSGAGDDFMALALFAVLLAPTAWFVTVKLFELSRRHGGLGQY
jgi:ABC-2 type transport system permease protein